jgi:hypothetical protein
VTKLKVVIFFLTRVLILANSYLGCIYTYRFLTVVHLDLVKVAKGEELHASK